MDYAAQSTTRCLGQGQCGTVHLITGTQARELWASRNVLLSDFGERATLPTLYRAMPGRNQLVAVKRAGYGGWQEAQVMTHIRMTPAASVVPIFYFSIKTTNGAVYTVMEYIRGRTLREVIRAGDVTEALRAKVETAIRDMHNFAGVAHRDLHPENVMVTHRGAVKIIDFGFAARNTNSGARRLNLDIMRNIDMARARRQA
jgi:serine/threonine protein kinase